MFLRRSQRSIRRKLRGDRTDFLLEGAKKVNDATAASDGREEWGWMRCLLAFEGSRTKGDKGMLPMRLDATGVPFETREDLAHGLLQQFAEAEKASLCTVQDLTANYNKQQKGFSSVGERDLANLHSLDSLRCDILSASRRRAAGHDRITNDVYLAAPTACARMLHLRMSEYGSASQSLRAKNLPVLSRAACFTVSI